MSIPKVGHGHEPNPVSGSRLRLSPTSRVSLLHLKDTNDKAVGRWRDEYAPNSAKDREHNLLKLSVWNPCARSRLTFRAQARGTKTREPRSGTGDAITRCLQRFVRRTKSHGLAYSEHARTIAKKIQASQSKRIHRRPSVKMHTAGRNAIERSLNLGTR